MSINYTVQRGKARGTVLQPHKYADGTYVASPDRFAHSQQRFSTAEEAFQTALARGWSIRMSPASRKPISLIKADRCEA